MIKEILDQVASEPSTNSKLEILNFNKDNVLLKKVFYLCYSKRIKFYVKQLPMFTSSVVKLTLEQGLDKLLLLSNRTYTGNSAIEYVQEILSTLSQDDAFVIQRIIDRDLKIGLNSKV